MNENKGESVSALIDGEMLTDAELDTLLSDESQQENWHNYHLIGDVMRNDVSAEINLDLSDKIALALEAEPTVLAPKQKTRFTEVIKSNVVKFAKPFGQMAIAASAAGLMVIGVQQNVAENSVVAPSQIVQTNPLAGIAAPVSYSYTTPAQSQENKKQAIVEQHRRFQALLSDHQQQVKLHQANNENKEQVNNQ